MKHTTATHYSKDLDKRNRNAATLRELERLIDKMDAEAKAFWEDTPKKESVSFLQKLLGR